MCPMMSHRLEPLCVLVYCVHYISFSLASLAINMNSAFQIYTWFLQFLNIHVPILFHEISHGMTVIIAMRLSFMTYPVG